MIDQLVAHGVSVVLHQPKNADYKRLSMRPDVPHLLAKIHDIELVSEASPDTMKSLTSALGVAGAACI
jgi:hypothetical protein